ncbi:hypothetical protein MKW92_009663 [Papaver armeniacum]|nr:hypothetical protein MKW92_009663 [Papaver armeniacum]
MANSKYEYVKSFEGEDKLMPSTWIVVRIDGRHFHQFSDKHEFKKPNEERALKLMNACAEAMFEEFPDLVFSYGVSDEYSFVFKKTTEFYNRRSRFVTNPFYYFTVSKIVSITVSFFTSVYAMKWKDFFPDKDLKKSIPSFDARTVCYPSTKIVRDYLAWRQVDCHINNQYNTCFWKLIESGKTKREAQDRLMAIFRKGSCVFKDKVEEIVKHNENGQPVIRSRNKVITDHCDIIGDKFWKERASILEEE